jgi:arsenate reductase
VAFFILFNRDSTFEIAEYCQKDRGRLTRGIYGVTVFAQKYIRAAVAPAACKRVRAAAKHENNHRTKYLMKNILVLCTGNSARSQMAHGYLQHFADTAGRGESAQIYSAGVAPHGVNPLAVQVMAEDGVDISHQTSNHADEYTSLPLDYVITVCDNAREQCPLFPSTAKKVHHSFSDPSNAPDGEQLAQFRLVRDEIKAYSRQFIKENVMSQASQA